MRKLGLRFIVGFALSFAVSAEPVDPIYKHSCGENGEQFWKKILTCKRAANDLVQRAFDLCVPSKTPEQAEITRGKFCAGPELFDKMLECYHKQLIFMQLKNPVMTYNEILSLTKKTNQDHDHSNAELDLSPGFTYRTCAQLAIAEAGSGPNYLTYTEFYTPIPLKHNKVESSRRLLYRLEDYDQ